MREKALRRRRADTPIPYSANYGLLNDFLEGKVES
jgi:hypothetical protein